VLKVANDLLDNGYYIYLGNWYSSPNLVGTLFTRKTDIVGTMRTNRRVPSFREEG
jgi:hypothetical protein